MLHTARKRPHAYNLHIKKLLEIRMIDIQSLLVSVVVLFLSFLLANTVVSRVMTVVEFYSEAGDIQYVFVPQ